MRLLAFAPSTSDPTQVWPGSQAIAKAKAYTANAFSLDSLALSTARLYVREKLDLWRQDYNQVRPHSALDDNAPAAFAAQWAETAQPARIQFQTGGESPQWALHWRYLLESVECINGQRFRP